MMKITMCPKSPSVRGLVASLPVRLCLNPYKTMHFTRFSHRRNATYNFNSLNRVKCKCVLWILTIGRHVNMRLNLANWGSWDSL